MYLPAALNGDTNDAEGELAKGNLATGHCGDEAIAIPRLGQNGPCQYMTRRVRPKMIITINPSFCVKNPQTIPVEVMVLRLI